MRICLQGQHGVISGGCSGIGLATAVLMRKAGASVTLLDRNPEGVSVAAELDAEFRILDVTDEAAVEEAAAALEAAPRPPTILVTSAGILQRIVPPDQLSWAEWDRTNSVHLRGSFACCRSFGSRMSDRRQGSIVTLSSVAGIGTSPLHAYGPAKAAIAQLSRSLAAEWGSTAVRVNSVAPGFTKTPALARGLNEGEIDERRLSRSAALGRLVSADEVAAAIVFLASPLAGAITGAVVPVDAGYLVSGDWHAYRDLA